MIITCSECETKFLVRAEQLGVEGRKVRCGNCSHVWLQTPPEQEVIENQKEVARHQEENLREAVKQQAEGVKPSLPTVVEDMGSFKWLRVAIVALVIANALAFIITSKSVIGQTGFYNMIGQYDTDGVVISEATLLEPKEEKGELINFVDWSVTNTRKVKMEMPVRSMKLLNKDKELVVSGQEDGKVVLSPGQTFKFTPNEFTNTGGKSKYLVLEIGNPYELSLR